MQITLTEKQVVLLGWDDKSPQNPKPIRRTHKGWEYDVDEDRTTEMRDVAQEFAFGMSDPGQISSAKSLLRKLTKIGA